MTRQLLAFGGIAILLAVLLVLAVVAANNMVSNSNSNNNNPPPSGDGGGGEDEKDIEIEILTNKCNVTVSAFDKQEDILLKNAQFVVMQDGVPILNIKSATGQVTFDACGRNKGTKFKIYVRMSGYNTASLDLEVGRPPLDRLFLCTSDSDCPDSEYCLMAAGATGGECEPVSCDCGTVSDHACVHYACCSDDVCGAGMRCDLETHACVEIPPTFECTSNDTCADDEYCTMVVGAAGGYCEPVPETGCGLVATHAFTEYECDTGPNCNRCGAGEVCADHRCIEARVEGPGEARIGEPVPIIGRIGGTPVEGSDLRVTGPDGRVVPLTSGGGDTFSFTPTGAGLYTVVLLQNGTPVKSWMVNVLAAEEAPPTIADTLLANWMLIVVVALVIFGLLYWKFRSRKGQPPLVPPVVK